jgi:mannose/fructose/N-acetylgalactosamine-specific phosphotransferase system component IID
MKSLRIIKIIFSYSIVGFTVVLSLIGVFISFREALYRGIGIETENARIYILTKWQAIIYNSIGCLFNITLIFFLSFLLYKKRYNWAIIATIIAWGVSFVIDIFEEFLKR